MILSNRMHIKP